MMHVITVHYGSDRWIPIQLRYLRANLTTPFRLHAFLVDVSERWKAEFDVVRDDNLGGYERENHALKLNALADEICKTASDADVLVFIDGDAFPIRNPVAFINEKLPAHGLLAVKRTENVGDIQPHPMFCVTTAGLWRRLEGDWRYGPGWSNARGDWVTDTGGRLLVALERNHISWLPLLRMNQVEYHRIWFGIYSNLIYHHGAGFRRPRSRADFDTIADELDPVGRLFLRVAKLRQRLSINGRRPSVTLESEYWLAKRWRPYGAALRRQVAHSRDLSAVLFRLIEVDSEFYRLFEGGKPNPAP